MRTQCCVACCALPALLGVLTLLAVLFVTRLSSPASPEAAWQAATQGLQVSAVAPRDLARLQFGRDLPPPLPAAAVSPGARLVDDYGRFVLLRRRAQVASEEPAAPVQLAADTADAQ